MFQLESLRFRFQAEGFVHLTSVQVSVSGIDTIRKNFNQPWNSQSKIEMIPPSAKIQCLPEIRTAAKL